MTMLDPQALCQLELHTHHLEATLSFFAATFGWQPVPIGLHEYVVLGVPDACPFGISLVSHQTQAETHSRPAIVPYFRWEEPIEPLLERVVGSGGKILWGPRSVPAYGQVYNIMDPGGIQLGLFCPS
jgi:predicted enzyme related to lactoylglutathione lyase